ncbi:hypothetical protein [Bradyrhizobium sp. WSM3983]|uniref:hypothetical protein n=1 Tax=Bradyrhizobium sp. WSM3983 TaxID=1038867 RepID=UPI00041007EA|nr:hypothetical protein [Bradyrhizobium sp. WSM3983]
MHQVKTARRVAAAFGVFWTEPATGRVYPCEAYTIDGDGSLTSGDYADGAKIVAAYANGEAFLTYEGFATKEAAERSCGIGNPKTAHQYDVRPLPAGTFFYEGETFCVVAASPISEAFKSPYYVAAEAPAVSRLVWSYRYWRQQASTRTAEMALFNARKDIEAGRTRYPLGLQAWGNAPFRVRSFENVRWIENPRAAGLRFVGYSDKIASLRHKGWFTDEHQDETVRGVVFQLAGKDGKPQFVPGYDNSINGAADSNGPCAVCFEEIFEGDPESYAIVDHDGAIESARRADQLAEWVADDEREYREANSAGIRYTELGDDISKARQQALALLAERRAVLNQLGPAN